jgi:hypothetical protein
MRSCVDCRRQRNVDGVMRCEERRSAALGGVIVLDRDDPRKDESLERVCVLIAARCRFFQVVS